MIFNISTPALTAAAEAHYLRESMGSLQVEIAGMESDLREVERNAQTRADWDTADDIRRELCYALGMRSDMEDRAIFLGGEGE